VADPAKSASACEATHSSARDALVGPHNSYFPFVIHVDGGEEEENPLADERRGEEEEEYLFEEEETGRVEKKRQGDGSDGTLRGEGCAGGTIPVAPSRRAIASVSRRVACAGDHDRGNADEERVVVSNRAVVVTGRACGRPESLHCPLDPAPARDQ
jgi:hypothetical protein